MKTRIVLPSIYIFFPEDNNLIFKSEYQFQVVVCTPYNCRIESPVIDGQCNNSEI